MPRLAIVLGAAPNLSSGMGHNPRGSCQLRVVCVFVHALALACAQVRCCCVVLHSVECTAVDVRTAKAHTAFCTVLGPRMLSFPNPDPTHANVIIRVFLCCLVHPLHVAGPGFTSSTPLCVVRALEVSQFRVPILHQDAR